MNRWLSLGIVMMLTVAACTGPDKPDPTVNATTSGSVSVTTAAQPALTTTTPTTTTVPEDPTGVAVETLISQTEELRGLVFLTQPTFEILDSASFALRLEGLVQRELDAQPVAVDEQLYRLLGVLASGESLEATYRAIADDQLTALYDSESQVLFIAEPSGEFSVAQKAAIVHELVHLLTDQRFSTSALRASSVKSGSFDEELAIDSLLEGDAVYVESLYLDTLSQDELAELVAAYAQADSAGFSAAPAFVQEALLTPYIDGLAFVVSLVDAGGFEALDGAYSNPPTSTEQIRHPEVYEAGDSGRQVELETIVVDGYQVVQASVWGESGFIGLLSDSLISDDVFAAAEGWNGDRFEVLSNGTDIAFRLTFFGDSAEDDEQFLEAVAQFLTASVDPSSFAEARHGDNSITVVVSSDPEVGPGIFEQMGL